MKRANHLIPEIADRENLYTAFRKAGRGKQLRSELHQYAANLEHNLDVLRAEILSGRVSVGNYHYFTIYDPKQRTICAASFPERVLHHALMNVCQPVFERHLIADSYATRLGKGTYKALERAYSYQQKYGWFLKLDIRKYFDSIDHTVLKSKLQRTFKEAHLLGIFNTIVDSYATAPGKGIPIGNLTSQYFANHYLSPADWYVKQELKIQAYVRYMDDMVLWHTDKQQLIDAGNRFEAYLLQNLALCLKKKQLNRTQKGLPFLSYLLFPNRVWLAANSRRRFVSKLGQYEKKYQDCEFSQREYQQHLIPLYAFVEKADSHNFRKKAEQGR